MMAPGIVSRVFLLYTHPVIAGIWPYTAVAQILMTAVTIFEKLILTKILNCYRFWDMIAPLPPRVLVLKHPYFEFAAFARSPKWK